MQGRSLFGMIQACISTPTRSKAIKRIKIEIPPAWRACAWVFALAAMAAQGARADDSLTHDARRAGTAIGSAAHGMVVGAKKAGITIGHDAKKAGLAVGHAAKAGGEALWHAAKGEKH